MRHFIVDNFYPNPHQARKFGLTLNFKPGLIETNGYTRWNYPGRRAFNPWPSNQKYLKKRFQEITGERILDWKTDWTNTAYHVGYEEQYGINWIHHDYSKWMNENLNFWAAVIYLHPDPPPRSGTTLYRHKTRGFGGRNNKGSDHFYGRLEDSDLPDKDDWIPHITIENVFNRCIIYPGIQYHAPTVSWFGDSKETGRLTQIGFWSSAPREEDV